MDEHGTWNAFPKNGIESFSQTVRLDGNLVIIFALWAVGITMSILWAIWELKVIAYRSIEEFCRYLIRSIYGNTLNHK